MEYKDILYEIDGPVAIIRLNRPRYHNAQSWPLLDELDAALERAAKSPEIKVAIVCGAGAHFSSGHDIGTDEQLEAQKDVGTWGRRWYDAFRYYNFDITLRWHHLPLPTIAMVHGYCIFGGWMIANAMDLIFASEDALFLAGLLEYFSVPWDVGPRAAKELLFESRFITAREAKELGMASRVYSTREELERETVAYAKRVAENDSMMLRMTKLSVNKMMDGQGYSNNMESAFHDYWARANPGRPGPDVDPEPWRTGERRLPGVALALRRLRESEESEK